VPPVAALTVKVDADISNATRGLDTIERKVTGMGGRLGTLFSTAGGFLLAQGVQAVVGNVGQLVGAALDFESQMANVNSILKISGGDLANLSDQVLGLTTNPGITQGPDDLAAGLYSVVSSGFEGAAALTVLEQAAMAATAGLTTTDVAAQVIVGTMNAYGHETYTAAQIADVLFKTVDSGVITFEQLASNMGQVLAVGASLGVGIDQLGAAYAQMTLNAVPAAQAETQIAALMRSALQPTDALTAAVTEHGYASAEALIAAEGMPGYLRVLMEESDGSKEALLGLVGSTEAMNAATILGKDGVEEYNRLLFEMTGQLEGGGAMTEALEKQMLSANYAIAKMKQQLSVAATVFVGLFAPAIRKGAEAFSSFLSVGVVPFANVISQAIRGGFEFRDVIDTLPRPLRATAGAVGTIAEGVGDLVRSFSERGLAGMLQTLTLGGEGRQILGGLKTLAEEGWDLFTGTLSTLASSVITLAPVVVRGAINLVGAIGDAAGRLYDWVKAKLFANDSLPIAPDGTGGPSQTGDLSAITLSDVVIEAGVQLMGGISSAAGRLKEWIKEQIFGVVSPDGTGGPSPNGAGGGFVYDISSIAFNILDATIDVTSEDVSKWIDARIGELDTIWAHLDRWGIILSGSPEVKSDGGGGDPLETAGGWIDSINLWVQEQSDKINGENGLAIDATNWFMRITGNPDRADITTFSGWLTLIEDIVADEVDLNLSDLDFSDAARKIGTHLATTFASNLKLMFIDTPLDLGGSLVDWVKNGLTGGSGNASPQATGLFDDLGNQIFATGESAGMFDSILAEITGGFDIFIGDITGSADAFKEDLAGLIKGAFDIDLGPIQTVIDGVLGVIQGGIDDIKALWDDLQFWKSKTDNESRSPGVSERMINQERDYDAIAPPFNPSEPNVFPTGGYVMPVSVQLDTSEAQAKLMALGVGGGTSKQAYGDGDGAFKATFDLDTSNAQRKQVEAALWGTTWAGSIYESMFNINDSDAIAKKTAAFLTGMNWAGSVFTARFSVDLSPLENAVIRTRQIAQEISDLLPNSPAKKGPLARPVSFGYIAENLEANLDRMASAASYGMGRVAGAFDSQLGGPGFGLAGASGTGGGNTVINVYVTPDSKEFTEIAQKAHRGGDFAEILPRLLREG
jgi:TP901 family phage tail tape measure protein